MHISPRDMKLSAQALIDEIRPLAIELEDRLARRAGQTIEAVRPILARAIGVAPGTLYNLRNNRLKDVGATLYLGVRRMILKELKEEMRRLENRISHIEAVGQTADDVDLAALKVTLAKISETLGEAK